MKVKELTVFPISYSMATYTGQWTESEASHLLRRTLFGPTLQQIKEAKEKGLMNTLSELLTMTNVDEPLTFDGGEAIAPFGTTWVRSVYPSTATKLAETDNARAMSLAAWLMKCINQQGFSIVEKMALFWQNHFAVNDMSDLRGTYDYLLKLRQFSLGNVRQLVKEVTIEPAMLVFLNGNTNTLYSPNENYARELLELFTLGKGMQVGAGDYSNYTETDIAEGAKILTGFVVEGLKSTSQQRPVSKFIPFFHDQTVKKLSAYFNKVSIVPNGDKEYEDFIDVIFQQEATARHISRKLYRYFVNYDITDQVEQNVISVMAQTLLSSDYEILPVLRQLLQSEHFFDTALRGSIIKSPVENVMGMLNALSWYPNADLSSNYGMYLTLYYVSGVMGQYCGAPPTVAGWPAYYQVPSFSRLWTNSSTIKLRFDHSTYITLYSGYSVNGKNLKIDPIPFYRSLSSPEDPETAIRELCVLFFPVVISDEKKLALKEILTGGLNDAAFTMQYLQYSGGELSLENTLRMRVNAVLSRIFKMPEYHTF